jgi:hypothetical protein
MPHSTGGSELAIARGNFALTHANKRSQVGLSLTKTKQINVFFPQRICGPGGLPVSWQSGGCFHPTAQQRSFGKYSSWYIKNSTVKCLKFGNGPKLRHLFYDDIFPGI